MQWTILTASKVWNFGFSSIRLFIHPLASENAIHQEKKSFDVPAGELYPPLFQPLKSDGLSQPHITLTRSPSSHRTSMRTTMIYMITETSSPSTCPRPQMTKIRCRGRVPLLPCLARLQRGYMKKSILKTLTTTILVPRLPLQVS